MWQDRIRALSLETCPSGMRGLFVGFNVHLAEDFRWILRESVTIPFYAARNGLENTHK